MKKEYLIKQYKNIYQKLPAYIIRAAGRVNLIGEHTDYNDGFVLPIAINRYTNMLISKNENSKIRLYDLKYKEKDEFELNSIIHSPDNKWSDYQRGIAKVLLDAGYKIAGMDVLIFSEVPENAGLSSSASIEIATIISFKELYKLNIPYLDLIKLAQKSENEFIGVECGIMDQFASLLSKESQALFLDCRSLDYQYVPLSIEDYAFLVCNSMLKRKLSESFYNVRKNECYKSVRILKKYFPSIKTLRDISIDDFEKYSLYLPEDLRKRSKHVVYENKRVMRSYHNLLQNNIDLFGKNMYLSHKSLKELYEVSNKELDLLVEIGMKYPEVMGAKLTGAGFGGCVIYLVKNSSIEKLKDKILDVYSKKTGIIPFFYEVVPSNGVYVDDLM